jgi:hypothetical protein
VLRSVWAIVSPSAACSIVDVSSYDHEASSCTVIAHE